MVFNVTFYNISVISWWSVLLVEETGENHRPAASHWPAFSHMLYWIHLAMSEIQITTVVVIGTDWTVSCKSNYHTITTMTSPQLVIYYCLTIYVMKNNYIMYSIKSKITIWCFIQRDCSPSYKGEGVSIFLTWGKHLHDCIVSPRREVRVHKTSLTLPLFIEVPVPSQMCERSCMCVRSISFASLFLWLDFGTVMFVFFILYGLF